MAKLRTQYVWALLVITSMIAVDPAEAAGTGGASITLEQRLEAMAFLRGSYDPVIAGAPDEQYVRTYDELISPLMTEPYLAGLSTDERGKLLEVALGASWSSVEKKYLADVQRVIDSLLAKGEATAAQINMVYLELSARRQFDAAAQLATRGGVEGAQNPIIADHVGKSARSPTALYLSSTPNELVRREVRYHVGARVIVFSAPPCPYCVKAAEAISHDPRLKRIFSDHSEWIAPPYTPLEYEWFATWRDQYPHLQVAAAYDPAEWPAYMSVLAQGTPTFYFFLDGVLRDRIVGWGSENPERRVIEALRKIGIVAD